MTLIPQYISFLYFDWVNTFVPLVPPKLLTADAFFIFLLAQFFRGLPRELDEAAVVDGRSPWRIILPVLAFFLFFQRTLIEGIATQGLKR